MSKKFKKYDTLNDAEKLKLIKKHHENGNYSIIRLAEATGTYPNKIRRDAIKFGVVIDDKSKAQKKALEAGFSEHPTEGKERTESVKNKIGKTQRQSWKDTPASVKKEISKGRKERYEQQEVKMHDHPAKIEQIKLAAKIGSKLERYLAKELKNFYSVTHQKEDGMRNDKFHIDIFINEANIAIEVDGPNHFKNIWGEDALERTKRKDDRKRSNILEMGYKYVGVINDKKYSKAWAAELLVELKALIEDIISGRNIKRVNICQIK